MDSDVHSVMSEHLRIRRHLRIISHRYRAFILLALVLVTGSQFACLLVTMKARHDLNVYKTGELAVCDLISLIYSLLRIIDSDTDTKYDTYTSILMIIRKNYMN